MLKQNLHYAVRFLRKTPAFAFVIVLTLALGIGANTAIFSVVYSALLRPLPYQRPSELLFLGESRDPQANMDFAQASYPDFMDWRHTARSFQSLAGYGGDAFTLETGGEPKLVLATQVTSNFFATLGVKPVLGRDFLDGEDLPTGELHVAILSDAFWRSDFHANPNVIGSSMRLDGKPVTIVGVLPRDFEFAPVRSAPVWVPLHASGPLIARNQQWMSGVARLAPRVSPEQARAEMVGITAQLARAYPADDDSMGFVMAGFRERISGNIRPLLLVLLGAVGFVLLIACANVANLLLTRSISRRKEFAVRSALGATSRNLVSQLLSESLMLSFLGAAVGLVGAKWGVTLLLAAIPESQILAMPYLLSAGVSLPVLGFLCVITLATGVIFGLAPAIAAARSSMNDVMKHETRGGTSSSHHARLRNSLVVMEIAVTLVLLVGGSLMLQSLRALLRQDRGFDSRNVLAFDINLPGSSYPNDQANSSQNSSADKFAREFTDRLRNSSGVVNVASTTVVPVSGGGNTIRFLIEGRPTALGKEDECNLVEVSRDYFAAMKIPLVQGRFFARDDTKLGAPEVVIVSRAFVKTYFPNDDPIGKRIRYTFTATQPFRQIVGVVGDTALVDLDAPPPPVIYDPDERSGNTYLSFVVRTASDPSAFIATARDVLRGIDPRLPLIQPRTFEQIAAQAPSVFLRSYPSLLIGSFAGLALILAMIGLYGVISYSVLQRTREIGIRIAVGAQPPDVMRLVLREGMLTASLGVAAGVIAGLLLTRLMGSLLYGVSSSDWLTFVVVAVCLLFVAGVACAIPARRATRVDPIVALHYE
jgi:putative ABC transport system permease protein